MARRILIVEDHDDFREAVRSHIVREKLNAEIMEAETGELGVALALRKNPDVILMDIRLPGITGIEAAAQIKDHLPQSRIIFLTMFETDAFKEIFKTEAASDYIGKSELYEKLVPAIRKALNKEP